MSDYDQLVEAFAGAEGVIHMAAIPSPGRHPDHVVHNNNVVGSYNALRAAAEHGILRVCQASSVNAIGHSYSRSPRYDYFPIDEEHPNYSEDPYSLSKWICEQQADSFVRRHKGMRIASMRFHWVVPERATAAERFTVDSQEVAKHLWAYTRFDAAADACLRSLTADFRGHEVFYIVAPDTTVDVPSRELAARFFPGTPLRGDFAGRHSFFSSAKAERLLGWRHDAFVPA
jgi:UDP-glucose 4-epimerase